MIKALRWILPIVAISALVCIDHRSQADDKPSPAAPLMKLLQSGKLPKERVGMVVEMVCDKGNADDLAYVFGQALDSNAWPMATRLKAFDLLADAARNRKKPSGDLSAIKSLVLPTEAPKDNALQLKAIRLAGLWKVKNAAGDLQTLALSSPTGSELQSAAIESLATIGGVESKATLEKLSAKGQPQALRYRAITALAKLDVNAAAKAAAETLADASSEDDPGAMLDEFLTRQKGSDALAATLEAVKLNKDVARVALRYMMSTGHNDQALSDVLGRAADVPSNPPLPTEDEVKSLTEEVAKNGVAARGEEVFRRADVSCMRCHSVSKAGGDVGPDLSPVGKSSPLDYIVRSILNPSAQIKEEFDTRIIITDNGVQYMGIVKNRNSGQVTLKDASGKLIVIPVVDIDEEKPGKSLMPEGITKFLTHQEFLDLAKFVGDLGKPGPFEIRTVPTIQRWRVLRKPPDSALGAVPNVDSFRDDILASKPEDWSAVYAKVAGELPVADAVALTAGGKKNAGGDPTSAIYLQGEIDVTEEGKVGFKIDAPPGAVAWVNADPFEGDAVKSITVDLPVSGSETERKPHKLTLRVPVVAGDIKVELFKPKESTAQFQPIGGT
jgi:putative heme-binding domain-containing protein